MPAPQVGVCRQPVVRCDKYSHRDSYCIYGFKPMVVITGQVPINLLGKDSFQEVDIVGVTLLVTKHNFFCRTVEELAQYKKSFQNCQKRKTRPCIGGCT